MQQRVEVQGGGSGGRSGSGGQEGRVERVRNRVESEGAGVDGGRGDDVDGVAGKKRRRQ